MSLANPLHVLAYTTANILKDFIFLFRVECEFFQVIQRN